jgi:hypothetical protein
MKMNWLRDYCVRHGRGLTLGAGALCLFGGSACTVNTTEPTGRLIVDWTIEGGKDPALCAVGGATDIDIIINTHEYLANCGDFATTISTLSPGNYVANAALVDGSGTERTTEVPINPFTITTVDLVIPIDFPATSFLP